MTNKDFLLNILYYTKNKKIKWEIIPRLNRTREYSATLKELNMSFSCIKFDYKYFFEYSFLIYKDLNKYVCLKKPKKIIKNLFKELDSIEELKKKQKYKEIFLNIVKYIKD
jgi:hypothetical protein